jgi:prolyl oligopeptidase PreP (S9A serine peptidase family)
MELKSAVGELTVEAIHGVAVEDPYRWLEDGGSIATRNWIKSQQLQHDRYFASLPGLDQMRSHVASYLDIDTIDQPVRSGVRLFYRRRRKGQEQACICMRDSCNAEEVVLVDPSPIGEFCNVRIHRVSPDGNLLAYELRHGGSDVKAIHIVDTASLSNNDSSSSASIARSTLSRGNRCESLVEVSTGESIGWPGRSASASRVSAPGANIANSELISASYS